MSVNRTEKLASLSFFFAVMVISFVGFERDFHSIGARLITDFEMPAVTLARSATVMAFFGVLICAGASIARATPQTSFTAHTSNEATVAVHWLLRAEPSDQRIGGTLRYSTGIAAVVIDAYGLGALGVLPVGPFIFTRWQIGPDTNGRSLTNHDRGDPANSQHVTFI
ncbi:hypothetical protein [Paraburkholderia fungorum]|uniref:hypothetical protein n=1 Tax=Paraburkholderia fungorum TaxID=134537 RepID=UPI0038B99664